MGSDATTRKLGKEEVPAGFEPAASKKVKKKKEKGLLEDILFDKLISPAGGTIKADKKNRKLVSVHLSPADVERIEKKTGKVGKYTSNTLIECRVDDIKISKIRLVNN